MTSRIRSLLYRFGDDRSGAIALLMGLLAIPLILAVGVFLDYSRSLIARERLANAIDAAALAVGASAEKDLTEAEIKALAQSYFDANYPPAERGWMAPLNVQFDSTNNKVTITANGKVDTTLMRIAGIDQVDIAANTEVLLQQNLVEIVMALDNTGSMLGTKLSSLKMASKELVTAMFGEEATSEFVKIGLVPFAGAVNVGTSNLDAGWIDLGVGARSSIHAEDFTNNLTSLFDLYDAMENEDDDFAWAGCVRARPGDLAHDDTPPSSSTPDSLFVPYLAPDEPDKTDSGNGSYGNNYLKDVFASSGGGGGKKDKPKKDKGGSQTPSDPTCTTDNADSRQRCTLKYYSPDKTDSGSGPNVNCSVRPILPLTNVKADVNTGLNAMVAQGNTNIAEGLAWAWRVISPGTPFTEGVAYDDGKTVKAIVLLTDGDNVAGAVNGNNNHNKSAYSAYGFARSGHLGATDGSQADAKLDEYTAKICSNVKAEDIRLYTITFGSALNKDTQDLMSNCATESSMYYHAPGAVTLKKVFADIAKGLNQLRIAK